MARAELKIGIGADTTGFDAGVNKARAGAESFASKLNGLKSIVIGAFSIGAVTSFARSLTTMADDMATAAKTVGITMQSMIGLRDIMAESGIEADSMLRILSKLVDAQGQAGQGNATIVNAMKALNIEQREFQSLNAGQLLELLARKYIDAGKSAEAFSAIGQIFGQRIGPQMIEVLDRINSEGLAKISGNAESAASGLTALAQTSDNLEKSWSKIKGHVAAWLGYISGGIQIMAAMAGGLSFQEAGEQAFGSGPDKKSPLHDDSYDITKPGKEQERWYKLYEESLLRQMDSSQKIAYWENEIAMLKKAQTQSLEEEYKKQSDILEREKKIAEIKKQETREQDELNKKTDETLKNARKEKAEYSLKKSDILAGKGIGTPTEARVDSLQRVGGLVGGVSGAGSQEIRIAERQTSIQEALRELSLETNRQLSEINQKLAEV